MKGISTALIAVVMMCLVSGCDIEKSEYPYRPIRLIVAFGAGGSSDTLARIFARYAEKHLNQRVIVINKSGAGGILGWTHLAHAKPDGYTIGLINSPGIEIYPFVRGESLSYDFQDIKPLMNFVEDPGVFAVSADSPFKNLDDFARQARAQPNSLVVSHEGMGGDDHLTALSFAVNADIELNFVGYSGGAEASAAVMGGHIDAIEGNLSDVVSQIEAGNITPLAVWSENRSELMPNIPTGSEQGYDISLATTRGIAVPAGTPPEIYQRLLEVAQAVVDDPEFRAEMRKQKMGTNFISGDEYQSYLNATHDKLKAIWDISPWVK